MMTLALTFRNGPKSTVTFVKEFYFGTEINSMEIQKYKDKIINEYSGVLHFHHLEVY